MKLLIKILLLSYLFIINANSEVIKEIRIDGNQRISSETVKIFSEVKLNSDLNINQINEVLKKLYSTDYFSNIQIKVDNNILYISVIENPIIQTLKFVGVENKRILKV